jgi:ribosomal protein S12 methylthiotransferase accessory factor
MIPKLEVNEQVLRDRYPFAQLVYPKGGLMEHVLSVRQEPTDPRFEIGTTSLGNLTMTFPHVATDRGTDARNEALGGAGADVNAELAWIRAVVEGAERYCCIVHEEGDFVIATARELGADAMNLSSVPRLSEREYADPACPFVPPDPTIPMRWTRAYSMLDRREVFVPSVMTHLYLDVRRGEAFWQPITTGVAAHTSLAKALVSAICELIERDAIALTWLCRLSLPMIQVDYPVPDVLATALERLQESKVQQYFFDATTDLAVPTVYALQLVEGHETLSQFVSCATDFDAAAACAKTIREAAASRPVFHGSYRPPEKVVDFSNLYDGAIEMGRPSAREAFRFLLDSPRRRALSAFGLNLPTDDKSRLRMLLGRLAELGMDAFVVDLTTDEVRDAGLWVTRVIVPQLVPMSSIHRARYLGHPRIYEYAKKAGYGPLTEQDINQAPQPFA